MKSAISLVALIFFGSFAGSDGFSVEDCGPELGKTIFIEKMQVETHPIVLTEKVKVSVKINVTKDIPEDAIMKVTDVRKSKVLGFEFDIRIPCLLKKIGSCTHKACAYLDLNKERACGFFPPGMHCECPVKAGIYQGDDIEVEMPDLGAVARWIAEGKYETKHELMDGTGKNLIACVKVKAELKSGRFF